MDAIHIGWTSQPLSSHFDAVEAKRKQKLEMKALMIRFPHLMEQILQKLDNKSLVKSREVAKIWQEFIDETKYPWVRIVKIPTIRKDLPHTYLHLAAKHSQIGVFEEILDGEADKSVVDDEGYTPFLIACLYGQIRIAEVLMKKSVELKIDLCKKSKWGITAFHLACISGNSELAEMIMNNSFINPFLRIDLNEKKPDDSMTGFLYACRYGHKKIVLSIMKNSKIMNIELNTLNMFDYNALHLAILYGHEEIAKILMEKSTDLKFYMNGQTKRGNTAFHIACKSGSTSIVKIILNQSEYVDLSLKTKHAETGFHFACQSGHTNIVEMLIDKSESINLDLTSTNRWDLTGFQSAVSNRQGNVIDLIKTKVPSLVIPVPTSEPKRKYYLGTYRYHIRIW